MGASGVTMCGLCGMFGGAGHWSEQAGHTGSGLAAERQHRVEIANAVLAPFGLRCAAWHDRLTLTGPTGRRLVVEHQGALWPAADKLAGRPIDPFDPELLRRLEQQAR